MNKEWIKEYENDVGEGDDECYRRWWTVSNGKRIFKCDEEEDATWLVAVLNVINTIGQNNET